uniref:Apoptosis inhibitor IAP n=1 Tax=Anoplophora glabripennis TaxID=217634 RepID=V5GHQ7_ANOGL
MGLSVLRRNLPEPLSDYTSDIKLDTNPKNIPLCNHDYRVIGRERVDMANVVVPRRQNNLISNIGYIFDEPDNGSKTKSNIQETNNIVNVSQSSLETAVTSDPEFESRLRTFEEWPNPHVSKESLAKAGFVYTGEDDIVQCPVCKIEGHRWVSGDIPMEDHRVWSPNCPFVRRNIEHDHSEGGARRSLDTCGIRGIEIFPNSIPEDNKLDYKRLGIHKLKSPVNEDKITVESRLTTFENWPKSLKQKPAELAEAGFYYTGVGDQTLCFYCGGGLRDWEEDDDPWEQHALWFSKCIFVILKKGVDYIEKVKREKDCQLSLPSSSQEAKAKEEPASGAPELSGQCEKFAGKESEAAEKTLCKICFKNELGVVFLPCGHIVACVDCAAALKTCAVCRRPLEATVRAFLS